MCLRRPHTAGVIRESGYWTARRGRRCAQILNGLGLTAPVHEHLRGQVTVLDAAWVQLADRLLEAHAWTGFLHAYVSGRDARMADLPVSVAALLIAEAGNVGLVPVTDPAVVALTRGRLSPVDQNYVRAETHAAANAVLVAAQARVPIARLWGEGYVASVDGLRFVVPVRALNAGPSPKYFGHKKGLTWFNAVNDQISGIGAQIVPGIPRDSLHILIAAQSIRNTEKAKKTNRERWASC